MLLLSKQDIRKIFTMKEAIEAVKQAFMLFSEGKSNVPIRTQIVSEDKKGTFLFMPSYSSHINAAGLKIVNIFPENIEKGLPTAPAQVLLMDGKTGVITAMLDGTYVTQLRTGAASGTALDVLARKDAKTGALIGTGGQAAHQLEALLCTRSLEKVKVYGLNPEQTDAFVAQMQHELTDYQTKILAAKTSDDAIEEADVIITVTSSKKPVFDGSKVKKGATISCVGAYQPDMQEIDPVILSRADKIYFDSQEAVLSESGDILIPLEKGTISKNSFTGDIGDVLLGNLSGRETDEEIIVFETVGIGLQDLVTANVIYNKAIQKKIGVVWE